MTCDVDTVLLRRLSVLVFSHHDTRFVRIAGITKNPVADWVTQCVRAPGVFVHLVQANPVTFCIRDRDTKFTSSFDAAAEATKVVKTPIRAPRADAICERVIGAIRRECHDRMLILGRRHLEAVLVEHVEHYHAHRSLGQLPPAAPNVTPPTIGNVDLARLRKAVRLGGLIHEYRMVA